MEVSLVVSRCPLQGTGSSPCSVQGLGKERKKKGPPLVGHDFLNKKKGPQHKMCQGPSTFTIFALASSEPFYVFS